VDDPEEVSGETEVFPVAALRGRDVDQGLLDELFPNAVPPRFSDLLYSGAGRLAERVGMKNETNNANITTSDTPANQGESNMKQATHTNTLLPPSLHAAYEWTQAAGELDELRTLSGEQIVVYCLESEENWQIEQLDGVAVTSDDLLALHDWLVVQTQEASR
jgi:hypothetical protein